MVTLRAGQLEADVAPEAGMVVASLRFRGDELLGVRGGLAHYVDDGATFGIPLLYPFANRLSEDVTARIDASAARRDETGLPIHGLPAARGPWTVLEETPELVRAELRWDEPDFEPPHRVEVTHELGPRGLHVTTRVEGEGVPVALGWHPYLLIDRATTEIEVPALRRLELDARGLPTGAVSDEPAFSGLLGERTFDDLFEVPPGVSFRAGRVVIRFDEGAAYAQVYAPTSEPVVAFEPMAAPTNALVTGDHLASSPYTLRFTVGLA